LNKLIGRRDVEDALVRLDLLTKEETLMAVVKNLEVTYRIDQSVKTTNQRSQSFLSLFLQVLTLFFGSVLKQEWMSYAVCHSLMVPSLTVKADARSQEINCKRTSKNGYLLPTLPSTTIMRAKLSILEQQVGLFKAAHFENGKRMVLYCGFLAIVSTFRPFCLDGNQFLCRSRCRKKRPLVRTLLSVPVHKKLI
jgi:hypothetical protein